MTPVTGLRVGRLAIVAVAIGVTCVAQSEEKRSSESAIVPVGAETSGKGDSKKEDKITVKAFMANDRLPAGGQCRVAMLVTIQDGWHINTNPAKPEINFPTQFTVKSKLGTVLKDVKYPEGVKRANKKTKEQEFAYETQVLLYGTLQIPKEAAGETEELDLQVKYQACNEDVCLVPRTVKLTGKVQVAAPGEAVKSINAKYFSTEK